MKPDRTHLFIEVAAIVASGVLTVLGTVGIGGFLTRYVEDPSPLSVAPLYLVIAYAIGRRSSLGIERLRARLVLVRWNRGY